MANKTAPTRPTSKNTRKATAAGLEKLKIIHLNTVKKYKIISVNETIHTDGSRTTIFVSSDEVVDPMTLTKLAKIVTDGFDETWKILNVHSAILKEHSTILNEHSAILNEHSAILKEHSAILKEHGEILKKHEDILNRNNLK